MVLQLRGMQAFHPPILPTIPRFSGAQNGKPTAAKLAQASRLISAGQFPLITPQGRVEIADFIPVNPADARDVAAWYAGEDAHYEDPKWAEWWIDKVKNGEPGAQIHKLVVRSELLGLVMTQPIRDSKDNQTALLVRGLRIAPQCNVDVVQPPQYRGVGKALVTNVTRMALAQGLGGITVNSSLGVEAFYEHLLGPAKGKAFDGVRSNFSVKGDEAEAFMKTRTTEVARVLYRAD